MAACPAVAAGLAGGGGALAPLACAIAQLAPDSKMNSIASRIFMRPLRLKFTSAIALFGCNSLLRQVSDFALTICHPVDAVVMELSTVGTRTLSIG